MNKNINQKTHYLFGTEDLKKNLKNKSILGGINSLAGESLSFALQLGSTVILARLLMPEDFGIIGMVTALTGFAQVFKDLGLSDATIQKKDITNDQISTLFWINLATGTIIMIMLAAMSPVISWFYSDQRLTYITIGLSTCFFWNGLTVQHHALLCRQMKFGQIALIKILSILFSIIFCIALAYFQWGYWALILKEISFSFFIAIGTWAFTGWRPGKPKKGSGLRGMLMFGRDITGFNIINYFSRNSDKILIGYFAGASQLGFYSKAYQLMLLPMNQLRYLMAGKK